MKNFFQEMTEITELNSRIDIILLPKRRPLLGLLLVLSGCESVTPGESKLFASWQLNHRRRHSLTSCTNYIPRLCV